MNNVRKHRETKNGDHYITSDISLKLKCLEKRKVTSSQPMDYMGITGKGMTKYLTLSTKSINKKQKEMDYITTITNQDLRKLLKKFKNLPYMGYKKKQVHN